MIGQQVSESPLRTSTLPTDLRGLQRIGSLLVDHGNLNSRDAIAAISEWYSRQCNGDWEHEYGIKITTLDNPGWLIEVDIRETEMEGGQNFRSVASESHDSWLQYWSDGKAICVACAPKALNSALACLVELLERGSVG